MSKKRIKKPYNGLPVLEVTTKWGHIAAILVPVAVAQTMLLGVGEPLYIGWVHATSYGVHIGDN